MFCAFKVSKYNFQLPVTDDHSLDLEIKMGIGFWFSKMGFFTGFWEKPVTDYKPPTINLCFLLKYKWYVKFVLEKII